MGLDSAAEIGVEINSLESRGPGAKLALALPNIIERYTTGYRDVVSKWYPDLANDPDAISGKISQLGKAADTVWDYTEREKIHLGAGFELAVTEPIPRGNLYISIGKGPRNITSLSLDDAKKIVGAVIQRKPEEIQSLFDQKSRQVPGSKDSLREIAESLAATSTEEVNIYDQALDPSLSK